MQNRGFLPSRQAAERSTTAAAFEEAKVIVGSFSFLSPGQRLHIVPAATAA
jgi:hypothetical protein